MNLIDYATNWSRLLDWLGIDRGDILALSGGGARGLAHIGVLQEIDTLGLKPDMITGTSMGAIIGALYCLEGNSDKIKDTLLAITESKEFKRLGLDELVKSSKGGSRSFDEWSSHLRRVMMLTKMMHLPAVMEQNLLTDTVEKIFGDATFEDLKIPFIAMATDLISGENIPFSSGPLAPAISASASIPGVFPPVQINGKLLVDGCVTMNVPIPEAESQNHKVIAVDVLRPLHHVGPYNHGIDILTRSDWITQEHLNRFYLERADLVIQPQVRHVHWADFGKLEDLVDAGKIAVSKKTKELKSIMK